MGEITNREFAEDSRQFRAACSEASIQPTKRQASKFRRKTGTAWRARQHSLSYLPRELEREVRRTQPARDKLARIAKWADEAPELLSLIESIEAPQRNIQERIAALI